MSQPRFSWEQPQQRSGVNLHKPSTCTTCGGQGMVTVGHRSPALSMWQIEKGVKLPEYHDQGFEETAPCPSCNIELDRRLESFWAGRMWTYGDRPGEVVVT